MPRFIVKRPQMSIAFYKMFFDLLVVSRHDPISLMVRQGDKKS